MSKARSKTGRKKGDNKKEILSQTIYRWASDVMKYKEADQLTSSDLKLYVLSHSLSCTAVESFIFLLGCLRIPVPWEYGITW